MEFPEDLLYSREHEWLKIDGEKGIVGITDYAQGQLGDIVFVEAPEAGRHLNNGESMGVVESVKAVSDIYSPITGEVAESNPELEARPELVNQMPYGDGWIVEILIEDKAELENLMSADEYQKYVEEEAGQ